MEEIVQELQKISEILLQNQTPAWLTYLSSLGPLILTGISVFIACGQHKQNQNLQKQILELQNTSTLRARLPEQCAICTKGGTHYEHRTNDTENP